jgi:hypothetical protein
MSEYQIAKDILELQRRLSKIEEELRVSSAPATPSQVLEALSANMQVAECEVNDFMASLLGAQPGTKAESKTWPLTPDPAIVIAGGKEYWRFTGLRFSVVRAYDQNGVRICTATLAANLTATGIVNNHEANTNSISREPYRVILRNSAGGAVYPEFLLSPVVEVKCSDRNRPVAYSSRFNPDVFGIVEGATLSVDSMRLDWC